MMHLLAKTAERREAKEQQQRHEQRRDSTTSSASDGDHSATATDDEPTPTAASSSSSAARPTAHRLLSLSGGSDDSLFQSPLSLVSSLSHSLLHTAKHSLSEGGHAGHKLLRQVRAGVRAGIHGIEAAAAMRNDREGNEHDDETEEKYPAPAAARGRNQRPSTADGTVAEEDAEATGSDAESESGDGASDAPLSAADLAVRRINFMRLLSRCEDMSYRHLHAPPGERPLLLVRAGEPNPDAAAFFRFVALLQRELSEHFSPDSSASRAGRGRGGDAARAARMLHADPRKDLELRRRVAFLATVSDKEESAAAAAGALGYGAASASAWSEEKKHVFASGAASRPRHTYTPANPARARGGVAAMAGASASAIAAPASSHSHWDSLRPPPLAHGVHSLRSSSVAAIASAASAAAAASSSGVASPRVDQSFSSELASPFVLDDTAFAGDDANADDDSVAELLERAPPPLDPTQELRAMLFAKSSQSSSGGGGGGGGSASSSSGSGGGATQSAEFRAEMEQRALIGELHSMTESLKANALRLRSAMGADARVLDAADTALDSNLAAIKTENARLKKWAHSGCSEMCWNILLIVVLWAVFIATFLFIKIFPAPKN
jgi:uncharacterized membrane protein YgcG